MDAKPFALPVCALLVLASLAPDLRAQEDRAARNADRAFLETLNDLEGRRVTGALRDVALSEAVAFLARACGIEIAWSPAAREAVLADERKGLAVAGLRNRLRAARERVSWDGTAIRGIVEDFAKRHGFAVRIDPETLEPPEGEIPPSETRALSRAARTRTVALDHPGETLEAVAAALAAKAGVPVRVAEDVPATVRARVRTLAAGTRLLEAALRDVAEVFDVHLGVERDALVFSARDRGPLPWESPRGFWASLEGEFSAEEALRLALAGCRPALRLDFHRGSWVLRRADGGPTFPWDAALPGHADATWDGETTLVALRGLLEPFALALAFPQGRPTIVAADDPAERFPLRTETYSLAFLNGTHADFPGQFPEFRPEGLAPALEEGGAFFLTGAEMQEQVIAFLEGDLLGLGAGDREAMDLRIRKDRIELSASPDVQELAACLLGGLRAAQRSSVAVSFHFLHADAGFLQRLIGEGTLSWGALTEAQVRSVEEGLRAGTARSVKRANLIAFSGQTVHASAVSQRTYVRDYDVEVAEGAQIGDPVIGAIREGLVAEVVPVVFGGGEWVLVNLRTAMSKILEPIETFDTPHGAVSLPKVDFQRLGTSLFLRDGGAVLVGGSGSLGVGKDLVLLLSVRRVSGAPKAEGDAPVCERSLRVYDIRDLTLPVPNRPGPSIGLTTGYDSEAERRFFDGEVRTVESFAASEIEEAVRERVDPGSWEEPGRSIGTLLGMLVVVQSRENHVKIEALLEEFRLRRLSGVEVVTRFLRLDAGELGAILGEEAGRTAGVTLEARQLEGILALATKREGVRLSDSVFSMLNRHRASLQMGRSIPYIRDVDVEVAQFTATPDPITGQVLEGVFLDYQVEIDAAASEVTLEIQPTIARLRKMEVSRIGTGSGEKGIEKGGKDLEAKDTAPLGASLPLGRIMLPELETQKFRTTLNLGDGRTALVYCPAEANLETRGDLVMLVTVRVLGGSRGR